jgi:hypothetical protein
MSDDFSAFVQEDGDGPSDGDHTAWLEGAVVRDTRNGTAIKCEWRTTDMAYWWESWHNTTGGGKSRTQELIRALSIDIKQIRNWEQLGDKLAEREGQAYVVHVSHNGNFVNTSIVERAQGVQTEIPADTSDFDELGGTRQDTPSQESLAAVQRSNLFDDDDIPF